MSSIKIKSDLLDQLRLTLSNHLIAMNKCGRVFVKGSTERGLLDEASKLLVEARSKLTQAKMHIEESVKLKEDKNVDAIR